MNEQVAIYSSGYLCANESSCINCSVSRYFPEKSRWFLIEQVCQEVKCRRHVKSCGQDTVLCKNILLVSCQKCQFSNDLGSQCDEF